MAERLPRYRPLGVGVPSIPTVDFAATGLAAARSYQGMSKSLDAMTKFALKQAEETTKEEAKKFAIENPITAEQIAAASQDPAELEALVGAKDTVFGSIARGTYAAQLDAELQNQVRLRLGQIDAAAKTGTAIDIPALQAELNGMIDGHSELISQLDPDRAIKYRASAGILANKTYSIALEQTLKLQQSVKVAGAKKQISNFGQLMDTLFRADAGEMTKLPDGRMVLVSDIQAQTAGDAVKAAILSTGDAAFIEANLFKIDEKIAAAKISAMSDHVFDKEFASDGFDRIRRVRNGDLGRYQNMYLTLSEPQKDAFKKAVREEITARDQEEDKAREEINRALSTEFSTVTASLRGETNPVKQEELKNRLFQISIESNGAISPATVTSAIDGASKRLEEDLSYGEVVLRSEIAQGKIRTVEQLQNRKEELNVPNSKYASVLGKFEDFRKSDYGKGQRLIYQSAKVLEPKNANQIQVKSIVFMTKTAEDIFDKEKSDYESGVRKEPPRLYSEIAREVAQEANASKTAKELEKTIENFNDDDAAKKIGLIVDEQNVEEIEATLERMKKQIKNYDHEDLKAKIKKIKRLIEEKYQ